MVIPIPIPSFDDLKNLAYPITMLFNGLTNADNAGKSRQLQEQESAKNRDHSAQLSLQSQARAEQVQMAQMKLALVQQERNFDFQSQMAELSHERALEIEAYRAQVSLAIADRNINFQKWQFEQSKQLQYEILQRQQDFQREVIALQQQNALEMTRERLRSDRSPITTLAIDALENSLDHQQQPLYLILSPPEVDFDPNTAQPNQSGWENFLRGEIENSFPHGYWNDARRPVKWAGNWETKKLGGGAALESLYAQLKAIPILVLESTVISKDQLNFQLGYWPGGNVPYTRQPILTDYSVLDLVAESAKQTALTWRPTLVALQEMGESEAEIQRIGGLKYENLRLYDAEEIKRRQFEARGLDASDLNLGKSFRIGRQDEKNFYRFLAVWHCLVIATYADLLFFRRSWENTPLLPSLLPHLLARHRDNPLLPPEFWQEQIPRLIRQYDQLYGELAPELHLLKPELRLRLAASVLALPQEYHYLALDIGAEAVGDWLRANGVAPDKVFDVNNDEDAALLRRLIYQEDEPFLTALASLMEGLNGAPGLDAQKVLQISSLLVAWQFLRRWYGVCRSPQITLAQSPESIIRDGKFTTQDSSEWWQQYEIPDEDKGQDDSEWSQQMVAAPVTPQDNSEWWQQYEIPEEDKGQDDSEWSQRYEISEEDKGQDDSEWSQQMVVAPVTPQDDSEWWQQYEIPDEYK